LRQQRHELRQRRVGRRRRLWPWPDPKKQHRDETEDEGYCRDDQRRGARAVDRFRKIKQRCEQRDERKKKENQGDEATPPERPRDGPQPAPVVARPRRSRFALILNRE
jgi:hypothetical protein